MALPCLAGFRAVSAVALSNVTIVGGTLTNFLFNVGRRHPLRPGPLINWDLILVMEPSTILGALVGGYINHVGCVSLWLCWGAGCGWCARHVCFAVLVLQRLFCS
jgi:hypothetical protein